MNKQIILKIDNSLDKKSVKYILGCYLGLSSSIIKELKKAETGIMLSGKKVFVNKQVSADDELVINISDKRSSNIPAADIPLDILYEDEDIIALNKPRNMPTHPSQNHYEDTLANGLMHYFSGEPFTFRAVTRLDRDTSGIVLVAKNPLAAWILNDDMRNKKIEKEYTAVVCGTPAPQKGRICAPIKRLNQSVILRCVSPDGKEALTQYEVVKSDGDLSLVQLFPLTGRTHQLRVHMSHIGTPIYGDDLYGAPQSGENTLLHCREIRFFHPINKKEMIINAPVPGDMTKFFK